jgi:hypothetical protein
LAISLFAVFIRAKLLFLFSFILNLICLAAITLRMILAFFSREKMKEELLKDFVEASHAERSKLLLDMDANITFASYNHNVGYLRECVEFFSKIDKLHISMQHPEYLDKIVWFFQAVPEELTDLKTDVLKILCSHIKLDELIKKTPFEASAARQTHMQNYLMSEIMGTTDTADSTLAELRTNRQHFMSWPLMTFNRQIKNGAMLETDASTWINILIAFVQPDIEEILVSSTKRKDRPYLGNSPQTSINLNYYLKIFVSLLENAHRHHQVLDPYIFMFNELHNLIHFGVEIIKLNGHDVNANVYEQLIESERHKLPDSISEAIHCYSYDDALTIFKCLCDTDAHIRIENNAIGVLSNIFDYSKGLSDAQKNSLLTIFEQAGHMDEQIKSLAINNLR